MVWIELLSPSNKPGGQDADYSFPEKSCTTPQEAVAQRAPRQDFSGDLYYREQVLKLLRSGVVVIEIDYLHESSPTFPGIPNYRSAENGHSFPRDAHPYRIIVVDPRPTLMRGIARLYQFDVDETLLVVDIPLQGGDVLAFDFGEPYTRTLEESMFGLDIDYSHLPLNFQRYRQEDQRRIAERMVALLQVARAGVDLETGPFPIKTLTLDAALTETEAWRTHE